MALLDPREITTALAGLAIHDVWGIGRQRAPMLMRAGIHTAYQLVGTDDAWLRKQMSVTGLRTVYELRGISCFPIGEVPQPRASLLHSESFGEPTTNLNVLRTAVARHARAAAEVLRNEKLVARELRVMLRTSRFSGTRHYAEKSVRFESHTSDTLDMVRHAESILHDVYTPGVRYVKTGVHLTDIISEEALPHHTLFGVETAPRRGLMKELDRVRDTHGGRVCTAAELGGQKLYARHTYRSPRYTTAWSDIPVIRRR